MEIWKAVPGYKGLYAVSNYGRVKSVERFNTLKSGKRVLRKERILHQTPISRGDMRIQTNPNTNYRSTAYTARLVAEAFIPNPEGLRFVKHKDGNKRNNNVDNLYWTNKINRRKI